MKKLIIAGGGTGGHIWAGVAIAEAWAKQWGKESRILFVGARGGLEEKLVLQAGLKLELLNLGSLQRVSFSKKFSTLIKIPWALIRSFGILIREKPDAVMGVGGYASGPVLLMAGLFGRFLGIRTAILEQNAVSGLTNRWLKKIVQKVFLAFGTTEWGNCPGRTFITGNPVRQKFKIFAPAESNPFTIFVFGGSQGALGLNTLVIDALNLLGSHKDIRWIHQTGEKDFERVAQAHQMAGTGARVEKFIFDMEDCYQKASLVLCRAGASTLAELAAVGRAAILVPLPTAADNHQEMNAQLFAQEGAAKILSQLKSKGADLAAQILAFKEDPSQLRQIEKKVTSFSRPTAARDIVLELTR